MAMLKKVNADMRTFVEISSVQEIPELKPYLNMTFIEIIMSWKAKKMHARMALIKWILLKMSLTFIKWIFLSIAQKHLERLFGVLAGHGLAYYPQANKS